MNNDGADNDQKNDTMEDISQGEEGEDLSSARLLDCFWNNGNVIRSYDLYPMLHVVDSHLIVGNCILKY